MIKIWVTLIVQLIWTERVINAEWRWSETFVLSDEVEPSPGHFFLYFSFFNVGTILLARLCSIIPLVTLVSSLYCQNTNSWRHAWVRVYEYWWPNGSFCLYNFSIVRYFYLEIFFKLTYLEKISFFWCFSKIFANVCVQDLKVQLSLIQRSHFCTKI